MVSVGKGIKMRFIQLREEAKRRSNNRKIQQQKWFEQNRERLKAKRRELAQTLEYKVKRQARYRKNPERFRATDRKWREKNIVKFLFNTCKNRAGNARIEFSLTESWIEKKLVTGTCERTGISFVCKIGNKDNRNPWFPSIDRINSSLGYTKSNCQMVCLAYNLGKNNWTDAVVLKMAKALVEYSKDPLE